MPLESNDPKGLHWERVSLPAIGGLTPGPYVNPNLTVDEFGRVTVIASGGGAASIGGENAGVPIAGGPFNVLNFLGGNITGALGAAGVLDITVSSAGSIGGLDEGGVVSGGPFTSINFIGGPVTATDGGSGQLDVTVSIAAMGSIMQYEKAAGGTGATQNIGTAIDATGIVRTTTVVVTTPYSGGATLQVEDGAANVLLALALINPQLAGAYTFETPENLSAIGDPQIVLIVGGAPGAGNCVVEVIYQTP